MPKRILELSAQAVARLREPGDHRVGGVPGLLLRVSANGNRRWGLRFTVHGSRRLMGLGPYPIITLAQARDLARQALSKLAAGVDPIEDRAVVRRAAIEAARAAITFDKAAAAFIEARSDEWQSTRHRLQWISSLQQYASPVIGKMDVAAIETGHVLRVLEPIWRTKTETATRVRGRIELVLDWCRARGHRKGDNPARWRGHLEQLLPNPSRVSKVVHHAAVSWADAPAHYARIKQAPGLGAQALRLLILTAVRSGELRFAEWPEFDLDAGLWIIPAGRMKIKDREDHRVPLSRQALALLQELPRLHDSPLVFHGSRQGRPLSDMTLTACMRRLRMDAVPHGWRSTFRDWASEATDFHGDVAEMALAHAIRNPVEAAYRRGDLFAKRRLLMQAWADYLDPAAGKAG